MTFFYYLKTGFVYYLYASTYRPEEKGQLRSATGIQSRQAGADEKKMRWNAWGRALFLRLGDLFWHFFFRGIICSGFYRE